MSYNKDYAIEVKHLTKHFAIYNDPVDRLKQMIIPKVQSALKLNQSKYYRSFSALDNISFSIRRGESVGVIGRNGAGKSTLLQIICGTLSETSGLIKKNGKVAGLLELGSGFNPEYTGSENIFLNATILGLSKNEIKIKYEEIINFANIGDFIDYPVKLYSSGMYVRLAFAIAINVDPDILIIDEALAVGDEEFQRKCYSKIEQIKERGTTVLFVSHSTQSIVEICDKALLIESGRLLAEGDPSRIVKYYQRLSSSTNNFNIIKEIEISENNTTQNEEVDSINNRKIESVPTEDKFNKTKKVYEDDSWFDKLLTSKESVKYDTQDVDISNIRIENKNKETVNYLRKNNFYYICYEVKFNKNLNQVGFGTLIKTIKGIEIGGASSFNKHSERLNAVKAEDKFMIRIKFFCNFLPGTFFFNVGILSIQNEIEHYANRILDAGIFRVMEEKELISTSLIDLNVDVRITKIS